MYTYLVVLILEQSWKNLKRAELWNFSHQYKILYLYILKDSAPKKSESFHLPKWIYLNESLRFCTKRQSSHQSFMPLWRLLPFSHLFLLRFCESTEEIHTLTCLMSWEGLEASCRLCLSIEVKWTCTTLKYSGKTHRNRHSTRRIEKNATSHATV